MTSQLYIMTDINSVNKWSSNCWNKKNYFSNWKFIYIV